MRRSVRSVHEIVVVTGTETGDSDLLATVDNESTVDVTETATVETVASAIEAVRNGTAQCLVCDGARTYAAIRDADPDVPLVAVTTDEDVPKQIVSDDAASFLHPQGPVATLLPTRIDAATTASGDGIAWDIAALAEAAIVQFDVDTYEVVAANDPFVDAWNVDPSDATLADLRVTDITHELRGQGRGAAGEEHLEWITDGGAVETFVGNALNGDFEVREWHCEGHDGSYFKSGVQIVVDPAERVGYLVGTVPEKRRSERDGTSEHDEASMLQSVMEHVPMSVYFEDRQGRHVMVSEDLVEPFIEGTDGKIMHTPEDVHGKTYWDLYPEDVAREATDDNERVMETGEPLRNRERHVQPPHGRDLWFSTNKAPWYDDEGRVKGIVGITVDITDQKRRERELNRQNERLAEFASILSHDLRNPLNVAAGRLELYRETGEQSHLDSVMEMHDRIAERIEDVLTFAREGSHVEAMEWIDGHPQAQAAWESVDTGDASLTQEWDYCIEAEPRRLIRLFENLFRNALEHGSPDDPGDDAEGSGSSLTVSVGTLETESGFYVADDGTGIEESIREELFDRGVTTATDGTGYGLAIVREIAQAHGWTVELAEPAPDRGARFEFTDVVRG